MLKECIDAGQPKVLVSIAAGVTVESITKNLDVDLPIIRIMPNTPVAIGKGMILLTSDVRGEVKVSEEQFEEFVSIMHAAGEFDRIREDGIDEATVATGCTPAYVYMLIEAMADGAVMAGVPTRR